MRLGLPWGPDGGEGGAQDSQFVYLRPALPASKLRDAHCSPGLSQSEALELFALISLDIRYLIILAKETQQ